jgi:hypothetical protein
MRTLRASFAALATSSLMLTFCVLWAVVQH